MYKVQIWQGRWVNRLTTSNRLQAIALLEDHKEHDWSSRILKDDEITCHQHFGLVDAQSNEGFPESDNTAIESLIDQEWSQLSIC